MNGDDIFSGLLDRGFTPPQAAALTGNILQESGGNPGALNAGEGAHGLLQWRNDRFDALQNFAKANGSDPADPNTQLNFIRTEMGGAEKRSSAPFLAAPDLESANAALKGYIRYGDNSQGVRLSNARAFLPTAAPLSIAGPQMAAGNPPAPSAPQQPAQQQAAPPRAAASPAVDLNALAAVPQVKFANLLPPRPNPFGIRAPFSLGG